MTSLPGVLEGGNREILLSRETLTERPEQGSLEIRERGRSVGSMRMGSSTLILGVLGRMPAWFPALKKIPLPQGSRSHGPEGTMCR